MNVGASLKGTVLCVRKAMYFVAREAEVQYAAVEFIVKKISPKWKSSDYYYYQWPSERIEKQLKPYEQYINHITRAALEHSKAANHTTKNYPDYVETFTCIMKDDVVAAINDKIADNVNSQC